MKVLVDMNLSPEWVDVLKRHGFHSLHWSAVGDPRAKDQEILGWARENDYVLFTHDLGFGALLALTRSLGPSVVQIRTQDVLPRAMEAILVSVLETHADSLGRGALISVDEGSSRVRVLPIKP